MEITVAKSAGFCFGVENAVKIAKSNAFHAVTLGEIIHNKGVVEELKTLGVPPIESLDEYTGGTVIIRSHGVTKQVIEYLDKQGIPYIDATCPFVAKIHKLVVSEKQKGNKIIIIGEKNHPEVIGTNGWCDNSAIIVNSVDDFAKNTDDMAEGKILLDKNESYSVVAQTTFSYENYLKITDFIKKQLKTVVFFNTICYTTKERQREAEILAKNSDMMLVVGGKHSSNTLKLYDICKSQCEQTYLIECIADLESVVANKKIKLGITAGASTPKELIEEVVKTMSESQRNNVAISDDNFTMEDVLNSQEGALTQYKKGQEKVVSVISANENGVVVDFGGKKDGFIPAEEAVLDGEEFNPDNFKHGDELKAIVIDTKTKDAVVFSKKASDKKIKELKECEEVLKGSEFTAVIEKAVPGGLLSKLGPYTIFVPGSQIKMGYARDLEKYVGKTLRLRMIPSKPAKEGEEVSEDAPKITGKRIVASQRVILEEERQAREDKFWSEVVQGAIVKGKVKRFTAFGAFVNVNGKDCLAHISDLSWYKIESPAEILEINKTYDFVVLKTCRENDQVSLGYKQLQKKPYELAYDELPVGTVIKGVVERVFPYGAFVSIKKGVDGLIPVSEISHEWVKNATEKFKPGDEVEAAIINFEGNKITLSVKALTPAPEVVEDAEAITDEDMQEHNEKKARANAKKFEARPTARKPRAKKAEAQDDTPKSWSTDSSSATIGDLFKGLNFDFADGEAKDEE